MKLVVNEMPEYSVDCCFSKYDEYDNHICTIDRDVCKLDCHEPCDKLEPINEHIGWIVKKVRR